MRDVNTVQQGEHVTVRSGLVPLVDGAFVGVVDGCIVIDHDDSYPSRIEVDSPVLDVCDDNHQILRVFADDPVLETIPADRE